MTDWTDERIRAIAPKTQSIFELHDRMTEAAQRNYSFTAANDNLPLGAVRFHLDLPDGDQIEVYGPPRFDGDNQNWMPYQLAEPSRCLYKRTDLPLRSTNFSNDRDIMIDRIYAGRLYYFKAIVAAEWRLPEEYIDDPGGFYDFDIWSTNLFLTNTQFTRFASYTPELSYDDPADLMQYFSPNANHGASANIRPIRRFITPVQQSLTLITGSFIPTAGNVNLRWQCSIANTCTIKADSLFLYEPIDGAQG